MAARAAGPGERVDLQADLHFRCGAYQFPVPWLEARPWGLASPRLSATVGKAGLRASETDAAPRREPGPPPSATSTTCCARPCRRVHALPERRLDRPDARRRRARGRGRHRHRPPGQGLPDDRGQGRRDPARQPRPLVGRQPPARSHAVRAGRRQPPQPRRQAARAAGLAGRPRPDRRPRGRLPQRRARRASAPKVFDSGTSADPDLILDKAILRSGGPAQPADPRTGSIAASSSGRAAPNARPARRASSSSWRPSPRRSSSDRSCGPRSPTATARSSAGPTSSCSS